MAYQADSKRLAFQFILLMGFISLFADITYEGARGVTGPYLSILGASAGIVGLITGLCEFAGYMLRLPFGYFADRTKAYWPLTIFGYSLILAIPLLGFAGSWQVAVIFILAERFGKAIRSPSRDAILSYATKEVGRGLGFGIHEAMDQIGAFLGPLVFGVIFFLNGTYKQGFTILWVPAFLALVVLMIARRKVPLPQKMEGFDESSGEVLRDKLPGVFWIYTLFIFLSVCGFVNFQLISYHFKVKTIFSDALIPLLYALAMGVDAVVALIIGKTYDRIGLKALIVIPFLTLSIPPLAFSQNRVLVITSIIFWGAAMGVHETIMRAAIADLVSIKNRGFAYGVFNTVYGLAWFLGSTAMGFLYDVSAAYLPIFTVIIESVALIIFFSFVKR